MAEAPKYVRDRNIEIAERKLKCPFCTVSNLTYRKVVTHYSDVHQEERKLVGIKCMAAGCEYKCNNGIICFKAHIRKVHNNDKSTPYKLCRVEQESNEHSKSCNLIMDKFMVELLVKLGNERARKKADKEAREAEKETRAAEKEARAAEQVKKLVEKIKRKAAEQKAKETNRQTYITLLSNPS